MIFNKPEVEFVNVKDQLLATDSDDAIIIYCNGSKCQDGVLSAPSVDEDCSDDALT